MSAQKKAALLSDIFQSIMTNLMPEGQTDSDEKTEDRAAQEMDRALGKEWRLFIAEPGRSDQVHAQGPGMSFAIEGEISPEKANEFFLRTQEYLEKTGVRGRADAETSIAELPQEFPHVKIGAEDDRKKLSCILEKALELVNGSGPH